MKRLALVAAIAALAVSGRALAEDEDHPWSIGAGIEIFSASAIAVRDSLGLGFSPSAAPIAPVFTVQRLFAPSTSVVFGVTALGSTRSWPATYGGFQTSGYEQTSWSSLDVGASVGILHELTSAGAPVRFSVVGSVFGAYARATSELTSQTAPNAQVSRTLYGHAFVGGVQGGIALDVALLERLSLRLNANLLSFDYAWSKSDRYSLGFAAQPAESSGVDVQLSVEPTLELRFAF